MGKTFLLPVMALVLLLSVQRVEGQCVADTNNIYTFEFLGNHYEIVKEKLNWVNAAA